MTEISGYLDAYRSRYGRSQPAYALHRNGARFRRERLPNPKEYYQEHLDLIPQQKTGWVTVSCCFHDDKTPSLSVNLGHGGFRCHGCGERGDLLTFHQLRYGLGFVEAAKDLGAWE